MSESLRDLVVSLSLNTDNFTRNIKSVNKQVQEAESYFKLASAGVSNFENTTAGLESKLSTLQRKLTLQKDAVTQYERALTAANNKLQETYARQQEYTQRLDAAKTKQSALKAEVEKAASAYEKYKAELGETNSATIVAKANMEAAEQEYADVTAEVTKLAGQQDALKKATQNAADAVSTAQTQLNKAEAAVREIGAAIEETNKKLRIAKSEWTAAGKALTEFSQKADKLSKTTGTIGRTLTQTITTPIIALGAAAIKSSMDFESAFTGVRKTVDASEREFSALESSIKQMSTEIAADTTEIANVMAFAGQMGIDASALESFTRVMIDLGNVGQSTVSSITACRFTNANTNGSSQSGYKMEVEVKLNNQWRILGYITATFSTVHMNWSNFTQTASAATRSLMGKYPPTGARLHVVNGYFHLNSGSTLSVTASMDLDYQTSTLSLDKTSCDAGTAITASISMNSNDLSHRFTWSFGSASFTSEAAMGVASQTVTIPANWMNQIPNATSGTATVTMQTYANSTLIGTTSANFTVTVPTDIVPIPGTFSVTSVNPYNGLTLQNVSSATATLASASGQYGATISRVQISGNGESASAYSLTTGVLKTTGNVSFTAQVWDTRGRTSTATASIFVTAYSAPRITSTTEFRCNASGTAQRNGTYASCKASWVISTLTGATATLTIGYKRSSGTWSPDTGYTGQASSGSVHVIGAGTLDIRYGWSIIYTVSDGIMSTSVTARVPSIERFLHFRPGGQGIGIGTMCEADQRVQINADWDVFVGGQNLINVISNTVTPISKGGTGATTVAAARNALGLGNTSGAVPIANGGTGQTTVAAARNALGLGNTTGAVPVANGGTGATTAANARTNLGAAASSHNHGAGNITSGTLAKERLPFKMECGSTTITGVAWKTVTFSTAFTAKPIIVVSYAGNPSSSGLSPLKTSSESKTGFQVCMAGSSGSGTRTVNWIAIQ